MIEKIRKDISIIDDTLISLLQKRMDLTHALGKWKFDNGLSIVDTERERAILESIQKNFPNDQPGIIALWREIMYMSKRDQYSIVQRSDAPQKIWIQWWKGSFNEIALHHFLEQNTQNNRTWSIVGHGKDDILSWDFLQKIEIEYLYTTEAVLDALNNGAIDYGQFAIANSIGWLVDETLRSLGRYHWKRVTSYEIPILHALMIHPDALPEDITTIMGHDQALRQCEKTLARLYPDREKRAGTENLTDNASIAEAVAHGQLPRSVASIGHVSLADIYGLRILHTNIQDRDDNRTTFVLVTR